MIVVDQPNDYLLLARQIDHAKMSGVIARAWRRPTFLTPQAWEQFVAAVEHHDDAWAKTDEDAPVAAKGRPADFQTIDVSRHVDIWRKSVEMAGMRGDYGQLVTAGHARWLYQSYVPADRGGKALVKAMMDHLDKIIGGLIRKLSTTPGFAPAVGTGRIAEAQRLFAFLDGLSLMMLGSLPLTPRTEPLPVAATTAALQLAMGDGALRIAPWPLTGGMVEVSSPVLLLPQRTFASVGALGAAIRSGLRQTRSWQVMSGEPAARPEVKITLPGEQARAGGRS